MTERKQGHSKLVYDKATRTIKTIDPHPESNPTCPHCHATVLSTSQPESVNDIVRKIVYQMSPADQYDLAFKVAENVGYTLTREPEHPDSPHLAAALAATPAVSENEKWRSWREYGGITYGEEARKAATRAVGGEALTTEVLSLLQASSCFRGEVCALLPCACAETLAKLAAQPASPLRGRQALELALQEIVLTIAFLGRDAGTDRLAGTIDGIISRLAKADIAIRSALSASPPEQPAADPKETM